MESVKTVLRRLWTGWILAFGLTGGYWGMALTPQNRWGMYCTHLDVWAILALTLAGGTILGLGAWALERLFPRTRPWLVASFWGWLAIAVANNYPELHKSLAALLGARWLTGPVWWLFVWSVGAAGIAGAMLLPSWQRGAAACWRFLRLFLWPLFAVPFLAWQLPSLDAASGEGLDFSRVPGNGRPATVVFMFDMLGYEELFDETGAVRPAYTNFAAFCERADVYHGAESAGIETATSIPGFIVQERLATSERELCWAASDWEFSDGTDTVRARDYAEQSLPAAARASGGRAQAIGTYVPWGSILPGVWDATESMGSGYGNHGVHVFGETPSFWTAAKEHFLWYFLWVSKSPLSAAFKLAGLDDLTEAQGYDERASLVERTERFLSEALSPGDFFFVHSDLPHQPYVLGRGGKPLSAALYYDEVKGLAAQTEGADWALGRWMEALEATEEGRSAWVIVTSDHNLHKLRYLRGPKKHVPFLVHRPGQTERRDVAELADLTDLRNLLPELPVFAE